MKGTKAGFTLLEVILVVAISTLLFMSVVIGIGSRIATGRYETASTEIADYLRDVFTVALNTENARDGIQGAREYCTVFGATNLSESSEPETGKKLFVNNKFNDSNPPVVTAQDVTAGRTNCAIYGKALYFGAKDGQVHVFDVVGDTVTNNLFKDKNDKDTTELKQIEGKTILEQLKAVRADIFAAVPELNNNINNFNATMDCKLSPAGAHTTYEPNWGALFKTANFGGNTSRNANDNFVGMVMIVRAPASGNVHTFFYENPASNSEGWDNFLAVAKKSNVKEDIWEDIFDDDSNNSAGCGILNKDSSEYKNIVKKYSPVQLIEDQNQRKEDNPDSVPENTGFCIGSNDFYVTISNLKKYVELIPGGQNASAIKLNEATSEEGGNPCYGQS